VSGQDSNGLKAAGTEAASAEVRRRRPFLSYLPLRCSSNASKILIT
jgi:hypothetical protein